MKKILLAGFLLWLFFSAIYITKMFHNDKHVTEVKEIKTIDEYFSGNIDIKNTHKIDMDEMPTKPERDIVLDVELQNHIWDQSLIHNWSYDYLLALSYTESGFKIDAYNNKNNNGTTDAGLYQINSSNQKWISDVLGYELDVYNPFHNIDAAIILLNYLRDKFAEMEMTQEELFYMITLAYNRGESGAIKYVKQNGFNNEYVDKVLNIKEQLEQFGTINEDL